MEKDKEITVTGKMLNDVLSEYFKWKVNITAVELNDDIEVVNDIDKLTLTLEAI